MLLVLVGGSVVRASEREGTFYQIGGGSRVEYEATAFIPLLGGRRIVGTNETVRGQILWPGTDPTSVQSSYVEVDASGFRSGIQRRDRHVAEILGAPAHPWIRLEVVRVESLEVGHPLLGERRYQVEGWLEVGGKRRLVRFPVTVRVEEGGVRLEAEVAVRFTDFGITPPRLARFLSRADDQLLLRAFLIAPVVR